MGAQENVATTVKAKTKTATIILHKNEWFKTSGPKGDDVSYRHDKENYLRISKIACVLYQIFLRVNRQCRRHEEMFNVDRTVVRKQNDKAESSKKIAEQLRL